jgi:ABC-type branched-subunit amino acid transport system ATPase component
MTMQAVLEVANHVMVMDEGKIIAEGVPNKVLEQPQIMEAYLA